MKPEEAHQDPLIGRYASREMARIFSPVRRFTTWRRVWVALARAEHRLGLPITERQIALMEAHVGDVDLEVAEAREREVRHDVMAHVHAFGIQCPEARPIIHLGATSCTVTDNADAMILRDALDLIDRRLCAAIDALADFAARHRALATVAYTHFQPAQPTTVGKRACLWIQDLLIDLEEVRAVRGGLRALGAKGTTGTQASFLQLFGGDAAKVEELDRLLAEELGFERVWPVTGQTYPRKCDAIVVNALSGVGQSAHRFANDVRLLSHLREVEEPFEASQIGSSAMPYKRNPMRCERMTALARALIVTALNPALTASEQWLERTLDDSANRRIAIPQAFLAADAILVLLTNVARGLTVNEAVVARTLERERPFLMSEPILMRAVELGGDRQDLHERIRVHAVAAATRLKEADGVNDLLERLAGDPAFAAVTRELDALAAGLIGRAPAQVDAFLEQEVRPALGDRSGWADLRADVKV